MSYWLEDADGKYLGDLATNVGIRQLWGTGPAIHDFLEKGEADYNLVQQVILETSPHEHLSYIALMLKNAKAPVYVTDGCGQADEVENVFCPTGPGGGVDPSCKAGETHTKESLKGMNRSQREILWKSFVEKDASQRMSEVPSVEEINNCQNVTEVSALSQKMGLGEIKVYGLSIEEAKDYSKLVVGQMAEAIRNCKPYHESISRMESAKIYSPESAGLIDQESRKPHIVASIVLHSSKVLLLTSDKGNKQCCGYYDAGTTKQEVEMFERANIHSREVTPREIHISCNKYFLKTQAKLNVNGHTVDGSVAGTARHELGHHVDAVMNFIGSGEYEINRKLFFSTKSALNTASRVSKYAAANQQETKAEMFCAATHPQFKQFEKESKATPTMKKYYARYRGES